MKSKPLAIDLFCGLGGWSDGSYYLWGDVPALMPITMPRGVMKNGIANRPNGETNFHGVRRISEAHRSKSPAKGYGAVTEDGIKHGGAVAEGRKGAGAGAERFDSNLCALSSKSKSRKAASASIAKIPRPLAQWIAKVYKPVDASENSR